MEINITGTEDNSIAEIIAEDIIIKNAQDALDIIANCGYQGAQKIIIRAANITPDFFDLKTGIAGEILQKFSTYNMKLALVGDFAQYASKSLKDFIYESNKVGRIYFVSSTEAAKASLTK
ncbi:DUF4180 domain-containing protein [Adhaeribacter radiodurans]|uniref:DUF4180 domain-containing protein n=1 Tax=Adhaeribacter radiodurans TaxID=2745197 RepID=A0A7L7L3Z0_9BACT|nr:DUF4180 domain-containing protein [Adhaeribacter radiodurans]QMU27516.1 DUF4180 domain-containing protein [Adhaeribacter radiodurans]